MFMSLPAQGHPGIKRGCSTIPESKGLRHVASLPGHGQSPENGKYGIPREQSQAAPLPAEFAYTPLLVGNGEALFELARVDSRPAHHREARRGCRSCGFA